MHRLVLAGLIVLAAAPGARGDRPAADRQVVQAEALAKAGDFLGAAASFKAAFAADPRPELICNVGVAYYKANALARAHLFLSRCLERGAALDPKFVDTVRQVLSALTPALRAGFTPVDITPEPAGATVTIAAFGADEAFLGARVVWLAPGKQALTAHADGYLDRTLEVDVRGRDVMPVRIVLDRVPPASPPPDHSDGSSLVQPHAGSHEPTLTPARGDAAATGGGEVTRRAEPTRARSPSKWPAILATTATVGAGVLAVASYRIAHDRADRAGSALTPTVYADDRAGVDRWNTTMGVAGVATIVGAGVSGYLWYRATRSPIRLEAGPQPGGAAISFAGPW